MAREAVKQRGSCRANDPAALSLIPSASKIVVQCCWGEIDSTAFQKVDCRGLIMLISLIWYCQWQGCPWMITRLDEEGWNFNVFVWIVAVNLDSINLKSASWRWTQRKFKFNCWDRKRSYTDGHQHHRKRQHPLQQHQHQQQLQDQNLLQPQLQH